VCLESAVLMQSRNSKMLKPLGIVGAGGFGRETLEWARDCGYDRVTFIVEDEFFYGDRVSDIPVMKFSKIQVSDFYFLIAIADPSAKVTIVRKLGVNAEYATLIHPSAQITSSTNIGKGSIICPNSIISVNVHVGDHVHLNPGTWIGHDTCIGDYSTLAPNAGVSGNCDIGSEVFLGASSVIKERITIASKAYVGMGAVVIRNLDQGKFVGNPARQI